MHEFRTFQDYVESQREYILNTVNEVVNSQSELKFGPNGPLNKLVNILGMYLSPDTNNRPNQLIGLGVHPSATIHIDLNSSQDTAAFQVVDYLKRRSSEEIRNLAQNLGEKLLNKRE